MATDASDPYLFEQWSQDVMIWSIRDDQDPSRKAVAIIMALTGTAYTWARTVPPATYTQGGMINGVFCDPATFVMHAIATKYAQVGEEARLQAMIALMTFQRHNNERIDELIDRFELCVNRAQATGQMTMSMQGIVLTLLRSAGVNEQQLVTLLEPTQGLFPTTLVQFQTMTTKLRRMGHIVENYPGNIAAALRGGTASHTQHFVQPNSSEPQPSPAYSAWNNNNDPWASNAGTYVGLVTPQQAPAPQNQWAGYQSTTAGPAGSSHQAAYTSVPTSAPSAGTGWHEGGTNQVWLGNEEDSDYGTDTDTVSSLGVEAVDYSDLNIPPDATREYVTQEIFWAYQRAKGRWRSWMGKPVRKVRRFVKRKGKGKGQGKYMGKRTAGTYLNSLTSNEIEQVFKGKGKGRFKGKQFAGKSSGKGKGRTGNPTGSDGQKMKCHSCGSEDHLIRECPRAQQANWTTDGQGTPSPAGGTTWLIRSTPSWLTTPAVDSSPAFYEQHGPLANLDDRNFTGTGNVLMWSTPVPPISRARSLPGSLTPPSAGNIGGTGYPVVSAELAARAELSSLARLARENQPVAEQPSAFVDQATGLLLEPQTAVDTPVPVDNHPELTVRQHIDVAVANHPELTVGQIIAEVAAEVGYTTRTVTSTIPLNSWAIPPNMQAPVTAPTYSSLDQAYLNNDLPMTPMETRAHELHTGGSGRLGPVLGPAYNNAGQGWNYNSSESFGSSSQHSRQGNRPPTPPTPIRPADIAAQSALAAAELQRRGSQHLWPSQQAPGPAISEIQTFQIGTPRTTQIFANASVQTETRGAAQLSPADAAAGAQNINTEFRNFNYTQAPEADSTTQAFAQSTHDTGAASSQSGQNAAKPPTYLGNFGTRPAEIPAWSMMPTFQQITHGPIVLTEPTPEFGTLESMFPGTAQTDFGENSSTIVPGSISASVIESMRLDNIRKQLNSQRPRTDFEPVTPYQTETSTISSVHHPYFMQFRDTQLSLERRRIAEKGKGKGQDASKSQENLSYSGDEHSCPVCLNELIRGEMVVTLLCRHCYHQDCWRGMTLHRGMEPQSCPVCRRNVQTGPVHTWRYLGRPLPEATAGDVYFTPRAYRPDGLPHEGTEPAANTERPTEFYPIGRSTSDGAYLVKTQLPDGRMAIIVDPGAWTNLCGGKWARECAHRAHRHNREPKQEKLARPLEVAGVGRGTQTAIWATKMPIAVVNKEGNYVEQIFEVPTLEGEDGADVPALLGLRSMRAKDAVLEMASGQECLTFPGPGGYKIEWSPGTVQLPLEVAPSGHYVIPCDAYSKLTRQQGGVAEERIVLLEARLDEYRGEIASTLPPAPPPPPARH